MLPSPEEDVYWRSNQAYATKLAIEAVDRLFTASGGSAWFQHNEMQRLWHHSKMTGAHAYSDYDIAAQTLGRSLLGLPTMPPASDRPRHTSMSNSTNLSTTNVSTVDGVEVHTDHWINGRWVASEDRFEDRSPIDGSHLADVAAGGPADVDAAVDAARAAFPAWAALGPAGRAPILRRFAQLINDHVEEISTVESVDNGSLLSGLKHAVIPRPR